MNKFDRNTTISFTPQSLTADGRPFFPMMGELHFSRVPAADWGAELRAMKAGGIDLVSLYVIWIHHEEVENQFDFTGDRDLRRFLLEVQKAGLHAVLRIGPWAHGEVRNGGFPDWLLAKAEQDHFRVRSDDAGYLQYAKRFYEKIYEQARGLFLKDDGPVLGVQIENEYGHCGGLGGEEGEQHMRTLLKMAREIGYDVPIYTATGWGGAVTGGMIPVMGGYCEAPWDQRLTPIEPSGNYIFTAERNDHAIGSDHGLGEDITFDMSRFPYLTAELGGGLQVTRHRRPVAAARDIGAMSLVKLGSGVTLLGYYMYHGGTNPEGKLTTLQESRETGYPNDLPVKSYDFNAPIREFGQMSDTFREIRLLSLFAHDFGERLCEMPYVAQPGNPSHPEDLLSLRSAVRMIPEARQEQAPEGYLFVNNMQRGRRMAPHRAVTLRACGADGSEVFAFPETVDIHDGDYFFFPFGMRMGGTLLRSATATPLCILHRKDEEIYVFYEQPGIPAHYNLAGELRGARILTISRTEALRANKILVHGEEYLAVTGGTGEEDPFLLHPESERGELVEAAAAADADAENPAYELIWSCAGESRPSFATFPALPEIPEGFEAVAAGEGSFQPYRYRKTLQPCAAAQIHRQERGACSVILKTVPEPEEVSVREVILQMDVQAESGEAYWNGRLVHDCFCTGQPWEIGCRRFLKDMPEQAPGEKELKLDLKLSALRKGDPIYLEKWPEAADSEQGACDISDFCVSVRYSIKI